MPDADLIAIRMRLTGGSQVKAEATEANAAIASTSKATEAANAKAASSAAKIAKTATSLKSVGRGLSTYVSLPLAGVAVASGMMALDFNRDMQNVNSIAQLPQKRLDRLKHQVLDLAGPTAQAPHTLAEGLYDLVSSGFDANKSLIIIRQSALAASAGLTTTEVSTKAVAAVLNAYQLPARQAGKVSDQLFETVNRGVLTFEALSTTIGDVLPFAAQLNVGLDQVGAAVSTMTKAGLSAPETMTRIKNVLVTLIKPGKDLHGLLGEMNTTGEKLVKEKGLQGALEAIVSHTNGSKEAIAALFPNIRALGGVLSLTGDNAHRAAEDVNAFKDTTGAMHRALHQQEKSFGFQLQRGWSELQAVLIELGEEILPIVVPFILELAHAGKEAVSWFAQLPTPLQHVGMALAGIAILAGPMLMMVGSILQLGLALQTLGVGSALAGAGPAVGFLAVLGLEIAGFMVLYNKVKWFRDAVDAIWKVVGNQLLFLVAPLAELVLHFGLLKNAAGSTASFLVGVFGAAVRWLGNALDNSLVFIEALPGKIGAALAALPGIVWGALKRTPAMLGRFIGWWLALPFRIGYIVVRLGLRVDAALMRLKSRLPGLAAAAMMALLHGFLAAAPAVFNFIVSVDSRVIGLLSRLPPKLLALGGRIISFLVRGLIHGASALWAWEASLPGKFLGFIGRIAPQMFEVGRSIASQIAHGLAQGLSDMLPGPVKDALGAVGGAAGDVGSFIGGAFAVGTNSAPGGLALVGEMGPELVELPPRSRVHPAGRTQRMLAGAAEGPKASTLAQRMKGADGRPRLLVPVVIKLGRRKLTEAVVETEEDAEARL